MRASRHSPNDRVPSAERRAADPAGDRRQAGCRDDAAIDAFDAFDARYVTAQSGDIRGAQGFDTR